MKIQRKMLLSYLLIVALFASIGAVITLNTMKMSDLQSTAIKQVEIGNYAAVYQKGVDLKKAGFLEGSLKDVTSQATDEATAQAMIDATQTYLLNNLPKDSTLYAKFIICNDIMNNTIDPSDAQVKLIMNNALTDRYAELPNRYIQIRDAYAQMSGNLTDFQVVALEQVETATKESQDYANFSVMLSAIGVTVIAIVSIAMALILGKRITNPLKKLTEIAGKVSMGELDHEIDIKTKDEISDLGEAFQRMINAFKMTSAMSEEEKS
jgi:nitrogen fixation/metabolism regulation signal transduction histidine kinase